MADKRTRLTLQRLFAAGRIPLEEDFADLFASSLNQLDDEIRKEADQALKLKIPANAGPKEILLLYEDFNTDPLWKMQIRNTGLEISRGSATQADLFIGSNGNLGIGTASPDAKLTLSDAFDADLNEPHTLLNLKVDGASDQNRTDIGVGFGSSIAFAAQRGGPNKAAVAGGFIDYYLYERPVGTVDRWAFRFRLRNDQWPNDDPQNPGSTVMTLLADGNVGIGTDAPDTRLHIDGKDTDTAVKILSEGNDKQTRITLGRSAEEAHLGLSAGDDQFLSGSQAGDLCLRLNDSSKKMRFGFGSAKTNSSTTIVIENGNVGIGTGNPITKLQVGGLIDNRTGADDNQFEGSQFIINQSDSNMPPLHNPPQDGDFTPKDTKSIFSLVREGRHGVNGNMADFRLGRYENSYHHSRSQLDIFLTHDSFTPRQVMTLRSDSYVGIGTDNPQKELHVIGETRIQGSQLEIGAGLTGNRYAYIDLVGDDTHTDFGLRMIRGNRGPNTWSQIVHRGTGDFQLISPQASNITILTKNTERMRITSNGNVGIGTTDPGGDMLDVRGKCYSSNGWGTSNGDYAELFEAADGKAIPAGTSVTVSGDGKIRPAQVGETPFGVVSASPALVGNSYKEWPGKYLKDEFGAPIQEEYQEEAPVSDEPEDKGKGKKGVERIEVITRTRRKLNPEYDPTNTYIRREDRPEWVAVGLLGLLPLKKGQPVANNWVKVKNISDKVELWLVK